MIDYMNSDDDVTLPADPQFDAWIEKAAPMLNVPPATPRADMWDAIQAKIAAPQTDGVIPLRRQRRWYIPTAIAAALLLGIAIDRVYVRTTNETQSPGPSLASTERVASTSAPRGSSAPEPRIALPSTVRRAPNATGPATASPADPSRLYRLAAAQTLTQAEALLTAYRAGDVTARDPQTARQLGTWGREVLSSTRLLMDSPAGDDPSLRALFSDLELVLVQIIHLSGAPLDAADRALIDEVLKSRDLLPRIRTAVPAGVAGAASGD
jgi:hypothetical protein